MRLAFRRTNDSADSPPYLSLLKLHTPPFGTKAGSAFFYADAERTQYLDMLQHLTQYSEELLLVVGDEGLGKSLLLDKYLERSEKHWRLCRLDGAQGVDLDTLFARVAECFAVDMAKLEVPQLLDALRQHLDALLEQQLSVLVIDDAQALSDDALEMVFHLAALEGEHGKLIRVLLYADSAIEARLTSDRFAQIASPHRLQLKALDEADSSAYLLHRLQQAGYSGPSPFSADQMKQLHRQSYGIPAQLNQAAHTLLLERSRVGTVKSGLASNSIRMGVAATALIGTVLGMHERINDLLGGDANSSVAVTAERPVLRLADEDNPWAVVIRDGESIQISCGAPAAETVAVRPVPASAPVDTQAVMKTPLIQPVSVPEDEAKGQAPSPLVEQPVVVPESLSVASVEQPTVTPVEKTDTTAQLEASSTPLVIKPPAPSITPELPAEMASGDDEQATVTVEPPVVDKLSLNSVVPDPVVGSEQPQTITILGNGLESGSKVAVSWGGKVKVLDPSQVVVSDAEHMELTLTTGIEPVVWAVQVSTPSKLRSNVLRFQIEAPKPAATTKDAEAKAEPEKAAEEILLPKKAEVVSVKPETTPKSEKPAREVPAVQKPVPDKKLSQVKRCVIRGGSWVSAQPGSNYTLQLLATSERKALADFVGEYSKLKDPLGSFEQLRNGKRLHVLTQGSYSSRAQAEAAAKMLSPKLQPWIRDFAGIKKVMVASAVSAARRDSFASGGIKDTAWVWSQKPTEYTIQLAGAGDEVAIEAVMRGISLPGELAVVETLRSGKPWYALIYGRFSNKEAAQGTVVRLPASLKKAGPWIRRFSALQSEIGQAPTR